MTGNEVFNFEVNGANAIGDFWSNGLLSVPDLVYRTFDTTLKLRSDGTGLMQFSFHFTGSSFVSVDAVEEAYFDSVDKCNFTGNAPAGAGPLKLVQFEVSGTAFLHLDADKKIRTFHVEAGSIGHDLNGAYAKYLLDTGAVSPVPAS